MKANEAPEKIYISHHTVTDSMGEPVEEFWEEWSKEKELETDIEYTRTDAFIEKACVWIKDNLLKHTYVYEGEVGIGMAVFLEEFKRAMKGE